VDPSSKDDPRLPLMPLLERYGFLQVPLGPERPPVWYLARHHPLIQIFLWEDGRWYARADLLNVERTFFHSLVELEEALIFLTLGETDDG